MTDPLRPDWMHHWTRSAPRPTGLWTVSDNNGHYGLLDPERGIVTAVDPVTDRRLPGIATARRSGDHLVAYRFQRRAVTRQKDSFTKIVRPHRATAIVDNHELLTGRDGFNVPAVLDAFDDGRIQLEAVNGPSVHDRLRVGADPALSVVSTALLALHATTPAPPGIPTATSDDPSRWTTIVARIAPNLRGTLQAIADNLPRLDVTGTAVVHTDMHDKNVLLTEQGVHFIDLDGLALGAPELDVVNLGVHLELRALQGGLDPIVGRRHFDELLASYQTLRPLDGFVIAAIERHTWFRLACLYLCRASGPRLTDALLRRANHPNPR